MLASIASVTANPLSIPSSYAWAIKAWIGDSWKIVDWVDFDEQSLRHRFHRSLDPPGLD
jgi:hypothetical protein